MRGASLFVQISTNQSARICIKDRSVVNFRRSTTARSYRLGKEEAAEVVTKFDVRGEKEAGAERRE